jgi:malonyl CoA-acyl carrier protein transacylase
VRLILTEGPEDQLTLTENAQPAIMANAIATLRVAEKEGGIRLSEKADFVAGHSLGEYTALCAAGALDLSTTARLLKLRGQAMQAATPVGTGAMAALLGADIEKAQALADAAAQGDVCTVANDNDPSQVVISGHKAAIERAIELVKDHGIKRGILLPVSAPFQCPLMQPAADAMAEALERHDVTLTQDAAVLEFYRAAPGGVPTQTAFSQSRRFPELDRDRSGGVIRDKAFSAEADCTNSAGLRSALRQPSAKWIKTARIANDVS